MKEFQKLVIVTKNHTLMIGTILESIYLLQKNDLKQGENYLSNDVIIGVGDLSLTSFF